MKNTDSIQQAATIGEQAAIDRIRAREIDGADHDVRPLPMRAKCLTCGGATYRNPALPYALIHRETATVDPKFQSMMDELIIR